MKFLDEIGCKEKTTLSRAQRYRMMKIGDFPPQVDITPGRRGWLEEDIDAWMQDRVEASRVRAGVKK